MSPAEQQARAFLLNEEGQKPRRIIRRLLRELEVLRSAPPHIDTREKPPAPTETLPPPRKPIIWTAGEIYEACARRAIPLDARFERLREDLH